MCVCVCVRVVQDYEGRAARMTAADVREAQAELWDVIQAHVPAVAPVCAHVRRSLCVPG
jgi:hypothetical protein